MKSPAQDAMPALALRPSPRIVLTRAQRSFLSRTAAMGHRGKAVFNAEEACAANNLVRLGFMYINARPTRVLPLAFPTTAGLAWIADELLAGAA